MIYDISMKESPGCLHAVSVPPPRLRGSRLYIVGCCNSCPVLGEGSLALLLEVDICAEHLVVPTGAVDLQGPTNPRRSKS